MALEVGAGGHLLRMSVPPEPTPSVLDLADLEESEDRTTRRVLVSVVAVGFLGVALVTGAILWTVVENGGAVDPQESGPGDLPPATPASGVPVELAPAGGRIVLDEAWRAGQGDWTLKSGRAETSCPGYERCSLQLLPGEPGSYTEVVHEDLSVEADALTFRFAFMGPTLVGDTDTGATLRFAGGGEIGLGITDGVVPNTGVALTLGNETLRFASWDERDTWYTYELRLDLEGGYAQALLLDDRGRELESSPVLALPEGIVVLEEVRFSAVSWNAERTVIHPIGQVSLVSQ